MSATLIRIQNLVSLGEVLVSRHGLRELASDDILLDEIIAGIDVAVVVEDYPMFVKGPSVLVLQWDTNNRPVHVLWGLPRNTMTPAVLVTAYRPDPERWSVDFMRRKRP